MSSSRGHRVTLGRLMILNGTFALLLATCRLAYAHVLVSWWACLLLALFLNSLLDLVLGIRCPSCRKETLRRLARPFSAVSYYECSACGTRCKRASPLSAWRDASGTGDAPKYRRKSAGGRWLSFRVPGGDDSTCGTLLRIKRLQIG